MKNQATSDGFSIPVDHVSDTAYLVAAYRVMESKSSDPYFVDSLATKLLGSKGDEILSRFTGWKLGEWMMTVRTTVIDRLLLKLVDEGIDTVINLAAGLDTRPYRLPLPKHLNWIEADLEGIIRYKNDKLKTDLPVCNLKRVQVNLADRQERNQFFSTFKTMGKFAVLAEGLLLYLSPEDVHALSEDLRSNSNLKAWLVDICTLDSFKAMKEFSGEEASPSGKQVHFKFLPNEGIHYFDPLGWEVQNFYSYYEQGKLLNRNLPPKFEEGLDLKSISGVGVGVLRRKV